MLSKTISLEEQRCFESKLVTALLSNPQWFPAVKKLSNNIITLLENNYENLIESLSFQKNIAAIEKSLFSDTSFGRIEKELNFCHTAGKLIDKLILALKNPGTSLPTTMHIHQLFMQTIFDILPNKQLSFIIKDEMTLSEKIAKQLSQVDADDYDRVWKNIKKTLINKIYYNDLFFPSSRIPTHQSGKIKNKLGITKTKDTCSGLPMIDQHQSALGIFKPSPTSNWTKIIYDKKLNFIAGPSGHAGSSLLLALLAGNFNQEEMKQYLAATVCLTTGGAYHTIPEILSIAKQIDLVKEINEYADFLPESFIQTQAYRALAREYPYLLPSSHAGITQSFFYTVIENSLDCLINYIREVVDQCPSYFLTNNIYSLFKQDYLGLSDSHKQETLSLSTNTTYLMKP